MSRRDDTVACVKRFQDLFHAAGHCGLHLAGLRPRIGAATDIAAHLPMARKTADSGENRAPLCAVAILNAVASYRPIAAAILRHGFTATLATA